MKINFLFSNPVVYIFTTCLKIKQTERGTKKPFIRNLCVPTCVVIQFPENPFRFGKPCISPRSFQLHATSTWSNDKYEGSQIHQKYERERENPKNLEKRDKNKIQIKNNCCYFIRWKRFTTFLLRTRRREGSEDGMKERRSKSMVSSRFIVCTQR